MLIHDRTTLSHKLEFSPSVKKMTRRGVEPKSVDLKSEVYPLCQATGNTSFKQRAEYIIIDKAGRGQLCL